MSFWSGMSLEELAASAPYRDSDGYMPMEQIKELTQTMKTTRLEFLPDTDLIADARRVRDKLRYCYTHKKLNILFLGMPGVGKSTLINSLTMAIDTSGYHEVALRGSYGEGGRGGRASITLELKRYKLFSHLPKEAGELQFKCQPRIWDCPGLPDLEDDNIGAIINLILDGAIPEGTNISHLRTMSAQKLYQKYTRTKESRKIHLVVVVHSGTDPLPENLLSAIRNATQQDLQGARQIPLFAVITKKDCVSKEGRLSDMSRLTDDLTKELGIHQVDERIFQVSLYCRDVSPELKRTREVDLEMCKIWNRLLDPVYFDPRRRGRFSFNR